MERLKDVLKVQSYSHNTTMMQDYIYKFVDKHLPDVQYTNDKGNIYITKGNADVYPCVVAHTDTVHKVIANYEVFEKNGLLFSMDMNEIKQTGIGGDDKVGIYIALECLLHFDNIKVAFFRDEETGCEGSLSANMEFFNDTSIVIQCDRRGYGEITKDIYGLQMYSDDLGKEIADLMLQYEIAETSGALTDVYQLAENGLETSCFNLACGYYNPHSDNEFVYFEEVNLTLEFVINILEQCGHKKWPVDRFNKGYSRWDTWGHYDQLEGYCGCDYCGKKLKDHEEIMFGICKSCSDVEIYN